MKPGDLVLLKEEWQSLGIYYGPGVIIYIVEYEDGDFISHKVQWNGDFSFHGTEELELISESR